MEAANNGKAALAVLSESLAAQRFRIPVRGCRDLALVGGCMIAAGMLTVVQARN